MITLSDYLTEILTVPFEPAPLPPVDIELSEPIHGDAALVGASIKKKKKRKIKESLSWLDLLDQRPIKTLDGRSVETDELIYSYERIAGHAGETKMIWDANGKCLHKEAPEYLSQNIDHDKDDLTLDEID